MRKNKRFTKGSKWEIRIQNHKFQHQEKDKSKQKVKRMNQYSRPENIYNRRMIEEINMNDIMGGTHRAQLHKRNTRKEICLRVLNG